MKTLINQIKIHAEAAKSEPDIINHLDAIIGVCGMLEQALKAHQKAVSVIEFTRNFHIDREREIDLNKVPAEKLVAAHYDKDRLQYTVAVLQEILKKINE